MIGLFVSNVGVLIVYTLFTKVMALDVVGEDHFFSFSLEKINVKVIVNIS